MNPFKLATFLIIITLFLGCRREQQTNWTLQKSRLKKSFLATNKFLINNLNTSKLNLSQKMSFFFGVPAQYALEDCRVSWVNCYNDFLLLSACRYFEESLNYGFIDNQANFDVYGFDRSYLDYTANEPNSGIVKDPVNFPVINSNNLVLWHQNDNLNEVTLGFHSIEYLLWGEDLIEGSPGQRTNDDFLQMNSENERRMELLDAAWTQLNYDLFFIKIDEAYENHVLSMNEDDFTVSYIDGIIKFINEDFILASLQTPLNSQDQKDEISDFSDNTLINLKSKLMSLNYALDGSQFFEEDKNTWYFMLDFIRDIEPQFAEKISKSLTIIDNLMGSILVDFDQAIQSSNESSKLQTIIDELDSIQSNLYSFKNSVVGTD